MRLQALHVENFRSFKTLDLVDLPAILLLFGKNGSGKSNVLAVLEAIFASKVNQAYQEGAPQTDSPFYRGLVLDFAHNFRRNEPQDIPFSVTLVASAAELRTRWPKGESRGLVSELSKSSNGPKKAATGAKKPDVEPRFRLRIAGSFRPVGVPYGWVELTLEKAELNELAIYDVSSTESPWWPSLTDAALEERESLGEELLNGLTGLFSTIGISRFLRRESFPAGGTMEGPGAARLGRDPSESFKRRLFDLKRSQRQESQQRFRRIQELFGEIGKWGDFDFAESGSNGDEIDIMTWDPSGLWLPLIQRGAGAEQLLVILSEVLARGAAIVGIEELESNLDDDNKAALFSFLEKVTSLEDTSLSQVLATAHTSFYAGWLKDHQKRFVVLTDAGSQVLTWSEDRHAELFGKRVKKPDG